MLSPDGRSPKSMAPSLWSSDSGYATGAPNENCYKDYRRQSRDTVELGLIQSDVGNGEGEGSFLGKELPIIGQVPGSPLQVFSTPNISDNTPFLPGLPTTYGPCLNCELRAEYPDQNVECPCRVAEAAANAPVPRTPNTEPAEKLPVPRLEIPEGPQTKATPKIYSENRCSACEVSARYDPSGRTNCSSCSPNPNLLSPVSPSSPQYRAKRPQAGRNSKLPSEALKLLQGWLDANRHNPYPTAEIKRQLAKDCDISEKQVKTWFTNARARQFSANDINRSGSEDEAARGNNTASLAITPLSPGSSFTPESPNSGRRRSSSAIYTSAATSRSAFSAIQKRLGFQSSRRGKKKDYRRMNPASPTPNDDASSPMTPETPAPDHRGDTWQCTFCRKHLVPKSWRRHEETQHWPKYLWICMLHGPRIFNSSGNTKCAFCGMQDPPEDHFLHYHRIAKCNEQTLPERTFNRPDHLRQHVENFHDSKLTGDVQQCWKRELDEQDETNGGAGWTCGFCGEWLRTWSIREAHIAKHFKKGMGMDQWDDKLAATVGKRGSKKGKEKADARGGESGSLARFTHPFTSRLSWGSSRHSNSQLPSFADTTMLQAEATPPMQQQQQQQQPQQPYVSDYDSAYHVPISTAPLPLDTNYIADQAPMLPDLQMDPFTITVMGNDMDWNDPTNLHAAFDSSVFPNTTITDTDMSNANGLPQQFNNTTGFGGVGLGGFANPVDYPPQNGWQQQEHQYRPQ